MRRALTLFLLVLAASGCRREPAVDTVWAARVEAARASRLAALEAEDGWLTLVARQRLVPGENVVGSDPAAAISLEAPGIPPRACSFDLEPDGSVHLRVEPGAPVLVNGAPPSASPLVPEGGVAPDVVGVGRVRLTVFEKDGTRFVRARDPESARRKSFPGLEHFPLDPRFRVEGRFEPYRPPREVEVPSSQGPPRKALVPGLVRFELDGKELSLEPTVDSPEDGELFFVFSDATAPAETYGGGRFLRTPRPAPGQPLVVLDFNLAETPPCSLTPYASCPMALPRNTLPVRVEAGEKAPKGH